MNSKKIMDKTLLTPIPQGKLYSSTIRRKLRAKRMHQTKAEVRFYQGMIHKTIENRNGGL
jgi:hypothetical protein